MADFDASASPSPYGNGGATAHSEDRPRLEGQRSSFQGVIGDGAGRDGGAAAGADAEGFPRKKRRKLTVDERKRAVRAYVFSFDCFYGEFVFGGLEIMLIRDLLQMRWLPESQGEMRGRTAVSEVHAFEEEM